MGDKKMVYVVIFLFFLIQQTHGDVNSMSGHFIGSQGFNLPSYMERITVNDVTIFYHDSTMKSALPRPSWLNTTAGHQHWEDIISIAHHNIDAMAMALKTSIQQFNLTDSISDMNVYQGYSRCELYPNGTTRALLAHAFNGKDFISLDLDRKTYVASSHHALKYKRLREKDRILLETTVSFYQSTCFERLKLFLQAPAVAVRKVPEVRIFESQRLDSVLLTCHVTGFYPRAVQVRWIGADLQPEDEGRNEVLPNNDGTYQIRRSVIRPQWRSGDQSYSCVVQHISIPENITVTWDEVERSRHIVWVPVAIFLAVVAGLVIRCFCRCRGALVAELIQTFESLRGLHDVADLLKHLLQPSLSLKTPQDL